LQLPPLHSRGLTEREAQVATYAAHGESGRPIGYRIGWSESTISRALDSAMHKLADKTQAQLVEKMRGLPLGSREGAEMSAERPGSDEDTS
jgi:DNA-binding NarL/FixJ family response regulator